MDLKTPAPLRPRTFALLSVLFFALVLAIFRDFAFDSSKLLLNADQLKGMGSRFISQEVVLPQWDNSKLGGLPTLDAMFGDSYHPLRLLQVIMDPARAVGWKFLLTLQIGFMGALLLFSRLAGQWQAGSLVALLWALNPELFTHVYPGHDGKMMVLSALPWALWGLLKLARDGRWYGAAVLGLALSYMTVSSHLQMVFFVLWGLLALSFFEVFANQPATGGLRSKLWRQALVGLAVAGALGSAAIQIFPPKQYVAEHSVRGSDEKNTFGHAISWSIHPEEAATLLLPGFLGNAPDQSSPDGQGITAQNYGGRNMLKLNHDGAGLLLLILALLAAGVVSLRRQTAFWLGAGALALCYSLGGHTPFFQIFYKLLPGVSQFRAPAMAEFWIPLGAAWMAASYFGASDRDSSPRTPILIGIGIAGALLAFAHTAWSSLLGIPALLSVIALALVALSAWQSQNGGSAWSIGTLPALALRGLRELPKPLVAALLFAFAVLAFTVTGADALSTACGVNDGSCDPSITGYFSPLKDPLFAKAMGATVLSLVLLGGLLALANWSLEPSRLMGRALLFLALAGTVEVLVTDLPYVDTVDREKVLPTRLAQDWKRLSGTDNPSDWRLLSFGGLNDNLGAFAGFRAVLGFHDNELNRFRTFTGGSGRENLIRGLREGGPTGSSFVNLLNARRILAGSQLMDNTAALPRVQLFDRTEIMSADQQLAALQNHTIDEHKVLLLEEKPEGVELPTPGAPILRGDAIESGDVTSGVDSSKSDPTNQTAGALRLAPPPPVGTARIVAQPRPDELTITVEAARPALLFHSENWHPYWSATVDGKPAPVLRAFTTLQAIPVPAGKSEVVLHYHSLAVDKAKPLVKAGLLLLAVLIGLGLAQGSLSRRKPAGGVA